MMDWLPKWSTALLVLAIGCRPGAEAPTRLELRDRARLVLEAHCGTCHIRDEPTAVAGALAIYDLRDEEWSRKMSRPQLEALVWRIADGVPFDDSDPRNAGQAPPAKPSPAEQETIRQYVQAELAAPPR